MKKIKIFSTVAKLGEIESNATTLGELKVELANLGIKYQGMKLLIAESNHVLESDNAVLPNNNFKLFILPIKTKSGVELSKKKLSLKFRELGLMLLLLANKIDDDKTDLSRVIEENKEIEIPDGFGFNELTEAEKELLRNL